MSRYPTRPNDIIESMISDLDTLKTSGGVKTIKRMAGELGDVKAIERFLTSGIPAILIDYSGGRFTASDSRKRIWHQERMFHIVCIAGSWLSVESRFVDSDDGTLALEGLLDYCTYIGFRTLLDDSTVNGEKILDHSSVAYIPTKYAMQVNLSCMVHPEFWDDDPETVLETIGICKSPSDYDDLFEVDNVTPKSDIDYPFSGGVVDL